MEVAPTYTDCGEIRDSRSFSGRQTLGYVAVIYMENKIQTKNIKKCLSRYLR